MSLLTKPIDYEQLETMLRTDPDIELKHQFQRASDTFYRLQRRYIHDRTIGPLMTVEGVPDALLQVDKCKAGAAITSLAIDLSPRKQGTYIWHINSLSSTMEFQRQITVSHDELTAELDYRRLPGREGSHEVLGGLAVMPLIEATYELAQQTVAEWRKQLPMQWPLP